MTKIDLLSDAIVIPKEIPNILRRNLYGKILSGNWKRKSLDRINFIKSKKRTTGENFFIERSSNWNDFTLQVRFKILSKSIKPPEGGAILYFLFKNERNFYSFHFCLYKKKIEFIKRFRGHWGVKEGINYSFEINREYDVFIRSSAGFHQCKINKMIVIENFDNDLSCGCIGIGAKYCDTEFSQVSVSLPFRKPITSEKLNRDFV